MKESKELYEFLILICIFISLSLSFFFYVRNLKLFDKLDFFKAMKLKICSRDHYHINFYIFFIFECICLYIMNSWGYLQKCKKAEGRPINLKPENLRNPLFLNLWKYQDRIKILGSGLIYNSSLVSTQLQSSLMDLIH